MKRTSVFRNTTRSILLAGLMCGTVAVVHAQAGAGGAGGAAGQAGTGAQAGGNGSMTGQPSPGSGGATTRQPGSAPPAYRMEDKRGSSSDSSSTRGSRSILQSPGRMEPNPSTIPGTPGT
ncbi:MAG: hypothetical protein ABI167_08060 [Nitrosospira sp.]